MCIFSQLQVFLPLQVQPRVAVPLWCRYQAQIYHRRSEQYFRRASNVSLPHLSLLPPFVQTHIKDFHVLRSIPEKEHIYLHLQTRPMQRMLRFCNSLLSKKASELVARWWSNTPAIDPSKYPGLLSIWLLVCWSWTIFLTCNEPISSFNNTQKLRSNPRSSQNRFSSHCASSNPSIEHLVLSRAKGIGPSPAIHFGRGTCGIRLCPASSTSGQLGAGTCQRYQ
jgi:hypothetical protein